MTKKLTYSLGGLSALLFIILAVIVKSNYQHGPMAFDRPIQTFAYQLQSQPILAHFFAIYTNLFGDSGGVVTAIVAVLILFFLLRQKIGAIWLTSLTVLSTICNTLVKHFVGRVRPDSHRLIGFAHEAGKSFASGHSLFATILFACLLLIYWQKMKSAGSKTFFTLLAIVLVILVMFSRIFVGVHYPSDTIGGVLEGLAFLAFSYPSYQKFAARKYQTKLLA